MNKLDKNDEKARELFFESVVKPSNPKIEVGKWLSANDLGIGGNYDNPDQKSFVCASWGVTSQKSHGPKTMFWDQIIPNINFMEWKKGKNMTATPAKRGPGRPKGTKNADPVGKEIPANEAQNYLEAFIQTQKPGTICYPYYTTTGQLIQIKTRSPQKQFYVHCWNGKEWIPKEFKRNGKAPIFGLEQIPQLGKDEILVICEGEKAAKAVQDAGFKTVGIPGASRSNSVDLRYVKADKILIWPDNDDEGARLANNLKPKLLKQNTQILTNELITKNIEPELKPKDDAADRTKDEIESIIHASNELFEKLSTHELIENWLSCFYKVGKDQYLIPFNPDQAAMQGRFKFNGYLQPANLAQIRKEVEMRLTLCGQRLWSEEIGPDPFKFIKGENDERYPSYMFGIFLRQQEEYSKVNMAKESGFKRMKNEPCYKYNETLDRIEVVADFIQFVKPFENKSINVEDTVLYKDIILPVLGDENAQIYVNWLSRYIAAYAEGKKEYLNRLPIMSIIGDPSKGKSTLASVINALHGGGSQGNLIALAKDPHKFGSEQLLCPFLVCDDAGEGDDRNLPGKLRNSALGIHTASYNYIEIKGKSAYTGEFRRMAMFLANKEEHNLTVVRELMKEDMRKRCYFLMADGPGVETVHGGEQKATDHIAKLLVNSHALREFVTAMHQRFIANRDKEGYIKKSYFDEKATDVLGQVSYELEITNFLKWCQNKFISGTRLYSDFLTEYPDENNQYVFSSKKKGYDEVRLPIKVLKPLYRFYRDTEFPGEMTKLVRYLFGENDNERGAISPLSDGEKMRTICKGIDGTDFERTKFGKGPINCICFKEGELDEDEDEDESKNEERVVDDSFKEPHTPKDDAQSYIDSVNKSPKPKLLLKEMKEQSKEIPKTWDWAIPK